MTLIDLFSLYTLSPSGDSRTYCLWKAIIFTIKKNNSSLFSEITNAIHEPSLLLLSAIPFNDVVILRFNTCFLEPREFFVYVPVTRSHCLSSVLFYTIWYFPLAVKVSHSSHGNAYLMKLKRDGRKVLFQRNCSFVWWLLREKWKQNTYKALAIGKVVLFIVIKAVIVMVVVLVLATVVVT